MIGSLTQFLKFALQKAFWFTVGIEEALARVNFKGGEGQVV